MESNKVIHLHLACGLDYYFGSMAAIYDLFTPADLGVTYNTLRNYFARRGGKYVNTKCRIQAGEIRRKKQSETQNPKPK